MSTTPDCRREPLATCLAEQILVEPRYHRHCRVDPEAEKKKQEQLELNSSQMTTGLALEHRSGGQLVRFSMTAPRWRPGARNCTYA